MGSEPRRCHHCGSERMQQCEGPGPNDNWICNSCHRYSTFGATQQPSDLDAALAIVRRRTPGEWFIPSGYDGRLCYKPLNGIGIGIIVELTNIREEDKSAIVAAVNNFEALAERCKRAEEWNDYDATIADLTRQRDELEQSVEALKAGIIDVQNEYAELERQRDELQNRCGELWELLHASAAFVPHDAEMVLFDQIQVATDKGAFAKGMADGKA